MNIQLMPDAHAQASYCAYVASKDRAELCGFIIAEGRGLNFKTLDTLPLCAMRIAESKDLQPDSYRLGKNAWIQAQKFAKAQGWSVVGSFHTHPTGPAGPSATDLAIAKGLSGYDRLRAVIYRNRIWFYDRTGIIATHNL